MNNEQLFLIGVFIGAVLAVIVGSLVLMSDPLREVTIDKIHSSNTDDIGASGDTGDGPSDDITAPAIVRRKSGKSIRCYRADEFSLQNPQSPDFRADLGGE